MGSARGEPAECASRARRERGRAQGCETPHGQPTAAADGVQGAAAGGRALVAATAEAAKAPGSSRSVGEMLAATQARARQPAPLSWAAQPLGAVQKPPHHRTACCRRWANVWRHAQPLPRKYGGTERECGARGGGAARRRAWSSGRRCWCPCWRRAGCSRARVRALCPGRALVGRWLAGVHVPCCVTKLGRCRCATGRQRPAAEPRPARPAAPPAALCAPRTGSGALKAAAARWADRVPHAQCRRGGCLAIFQP